MVLGSGRFPVLKGLIFQSITTKIIFLLGNRGTNLTWPACLFPALYDYYKAKLATALVIVFEREVRQRLGIRLRIKDICLTIIFFQINLQL